MGPFKLISLKIGKENTENESKIQEYIFSTVANGNRQSPFISLIIGANATGKTRLLRLITEIFNDLYIYKNAEGTKIFPNENFILIYKIGIDEYNIEGSTSTGFIIKCNQKSINKENLDLPSNLVCLSHSITDRFPQGHNFTNLRQRSKYDNEFYHYLGARTFNNMASSTGHITRALDLLANAFSKNTFNHKMPEIFKLLDLHPIIRVQFRKGFTLAGKLGNKRITKVDLKREINNLDERKTGFSYNKFQKLLIEDVHLEEAVDYYNQLLAFQNSKRDYEFEINFKNPSVQSSFFNNYKAISTLRKLNLIRYGEIQVIRRNGKIFNINHGSSGEIQIFTSFLSLSSVITERSLVLIDEPEISLHPNWQMEYIDLINSVFKHLFESHFIISSHSHFLASDLPPKTSSLISFKKDDNGEVISELQPEKTFGWSAEQILLEIFNMPTTRNLFVYKTVGEILNINSKPKKSKKDIESIVFRVKKLQSFNIDELDERDPLKEIIDKLIKKYGKK